MPNLDRVFPSIAKMLAAALLLASSGTVLAADHEDTLIEKGRQLFTESAGDTGCAVCHGETAVGNPDAGAPFIQGISRARLNAALTGAVPAMEYFKLNRRETESIYEFLQYMSHAEDVEMNEDAAAGKVIFDETAGGVGCQACHGADGSGDSAPDIRGRDARTILDQLRRNENMAFIKLNRKQVDQVAAYLDYLHALETH
uniref:cytochrome c n=1 Tax=Pararhizobium sp. IMCC3301 TaxID=3067904 RepID=UPI002740BC57|nr:cytochrome c [Pararhizobium sp. IMCC3301]